ncbi:MAG TPA: hypothetical protein VER55_16130, partial [Ardenticatenaceae bacterium]|nr:hypothetical protein [Ardenticatenaceae bacterium]
ALPALRAGAESADPTLSGRAAELLTWSRDLQPATVSPRLPSVEVTPLAAPDEGLPAWLRLAIVTVTAGLAVVVLAGLPAARRRAHSQP